MARNLADPFAHFKSRSSYCLVPVAGIVLK
jgi:hypothetical protein